MDDYQATYNKRWPNLSLMSVQVFTFVGSRPPQHSWLPAATLKSLWNAEFRVDDRLRPCKHISLEFPSHIFIVALSTRVGKQPNCDSTCFSGCEFFLQLDFITAMIHILICQFCIPGSVVRALRFTSERLPVLIQTVCFCSSGKGAPILFKSSEPKPPLSQSHHWLPPRG
jgi:hypothetical protein